MSAIVDRLVTAVHRLSRASMGDQMLAANNELRDARTAIEAALAQQVPPVKFMHDESCPAGWGRDDTHCNCRPVAQQVQPDCLCCGTALPHKRDATCPRQQAQPLTDEMIEAESHKIFLPAIAAVGEERHWIFALGAKFARDRMAQQAQPCEHECADGQGVWIWKCTDCGQVFPDVQAPLAQYAVAAMQSGKSWPSGLPYDGEQAHPEMPTPDAIADKMQRFFDGRDDVAQRRRHLALDCARAVLALFVPKETTCELHVCDGACDRRNGNHTDACEARYNALNP